MKHYFEIKPYISSEKTQFYTIEEVGKGINETDEFFIRFKDDPIIKKILKPSSTGSKKLEKSLVPWKGISDLSHGQKQSHH